MSKIIQLDKNLANQIAAGEVVERPVSVVKELVENSIDAGANNIKIEIKTWGSEYISITDNGEGIEKEDLPLVIEKYSTSKIKNIEDLYHVMTFWFRWEALASIASVSNLTLLSKYQEADSWYAFSTSNSEIWDIQPCACEVGTKIQVENLFYNTPARLNYIKKPRTEYNHILSLLQHMCLSYPSIGFEFISDNKQIFKYQKNENLATRIYSIYGNDFSDHLLEIDFELHGIHISGYISDPKTSFPNKNRQCLFVNKRVIKSNLIFKAINDAYNRFIPHGCFPAYVLNIQVDPTQVDVNVHPRKMEVRFASEQNIFRSLYHAVEEKLDKVSLISSEKTEIPLSNTQTFWNQIREPEKNYYTGSGTKFKAYSPYSERNTNPNQWTIGASLNFSKEILGNRNASFGSTIEKEEEIGKSTDLHDTPLGKIIGQAHNCYIIIETPEGIKVLDQHALAERVLYEKLLNSQYKEKAQWLLIGENFHLTPKERNILEENKEIFEEMGFDFEILSGNNILLSGIPDFIKKENIRNIFLWILEDIGEENFWKSKTLQEVRNTIFACAACRGSIKFWHKLNLFEMNKLLQDAAIDYSATCPHGRPVVFEITLEEMKNKYER